jgi:hypothetical protein
MQLSKSDYLLYLKHPAWLWLKKYDKSKLPPVDDNLQAIFDTGHSFEPYAESLFPDGVQLGFDDYQSYKSLPERTEAAIQQGEKTIFQGRFEHGSLTFICDIIDFVDEGVVDLYEIKSTTIAKPEHEDDLAFQLIVLEGCGFEVRNIAVIHVNNQYVRSSKIDPKELTTITDVTDVVKTKREETKERTSAALDMLNNHNGTHPDFSPTLASSKDFREWLDIYKHLYPPPDGSIYTLCQLDAKLLINLQAAGIEYITDIPEDYALKPKQALQVEAAKTKKPIIHAKKIKDFLDTLKYPLYFLDYETMSSLVPYFDGMRPYQQVPFQYSLHVVDAPQSEPRHLEYLHQDFSNPAESVAKSLQEHIANTGSIITWNMGFEKNCNNTLAYFAPEYAEFLAGVNERIVDLMIPFSKSWYVDAAFRGSASIKAVLPVLVPELSYKELEIQEGGSAQRIWMQTILDGKNEHDKEKILNDLIAYCQLDTLAMVKIHQKLIQTTSS